MGEMAPLDKLIGIAAVTGIIIGAALMLGLIDRRHFHPRWLLVAAGLMIANDLLLSFTPDLAPGSRWNWAGKIAALSFTLAVAALPALGWHRVGLTLRQRREGRPVTYAVILATTLLFGAFALSLPAEAPSLDDYAFQLTMPGLEEESFYRGTLLLAFNEALRGRLRFLGIEWSWGGILATTAFGLAHALSFDNGVMAFDGMAMAMTGVPALILLWVRERTGSLLWPVLLHNYANVIPMIL